MKAVAALALLCGLAIGGCTLDPNAYGVETVGNANPATRGVVLSSRRVPVTDGQAGAATLGGAAGGTAIGAGLSRNGAPAGALAGALVGAAVDLSRPQQMATEYVIQTESGALLTVVQLDKDPLPPRRRVVVMYGSPIRVIPDDSRP